VLGSRENQHLMPLTFLDQNAQQVTLLFLRTRYAHCSTSSMGALRGATWMDSGRGNSRSARPRMSSEYVAENNQVLALLRQEAMIF